MKKVIMVSLLSLSTITFYSCGTSNAETPKTKVETAKVETKEDVETWVYDSPENEMGEKSVMARIISTNKVNFEFPYNGGSLGSITFRKKGNDLSAMFIITKGQIDFDYDGTYARIKFDDESPIKWEISQSASSNSEIAFFENEKKLLDKFKKSKKVVVEIGFYQSGNSQFTFNTEGLTF